MRRRNQQLLQEAIVRRIRQRKALIKERNILKAHRRRILNSSAINKHSSNRSKIQNITVQLAEDFRLLTQPDIVLKTIRDLSKIKNNTTSRQHIYLNLQNVKHLDIGSLSMLLAVVNSYKSNISVIGNYPLNHNCYQFFVDSGFLDHMKSIQGKKPEKKNPNNLMLQRGFDKTSNHKIGLEVRHAVKHLTGTENSYRPVFSIIQEMCANSIEHANVSKQDKNWLVTLYYTDDKVIFTMIDIGKGILATLRKKVSQVIKDTLSIKTDLGTLIGAFDKKYQSSTFDDNRNKGLPRIQDTNNYDFIENLVVITNNVFLDFTNKEKSKELKTKFNGTFYYWELTKNCIETWKNRKTS